MVPPFLSVCICTAHRAPDLRVTLDVLAKAAAPERPWELVVVNNRPGDPATDDALASAPSRLPLVAVEEARAGQSHARNKAVDVARGELLVFTDDDVSVDPQWLRAYERAASEVPSAAVFGGPIRPVFEGATQAWIRDVQAHVPTSFAWLDPKGDVRIAADDDSAITPFGANFAVRAGVLASERFDTRLGRGADRPLLSGEETKLLCALLRKGAQGRWLRDAPVLHRIGRERMTREYQRRYWHGIGYGLGMDDAATHPDDLARHGAYIARRLAAARRRWRLRGWWRKRSAWLPALRDLARWQGRSDGFAAAIAEEGLS